MADLIPRAAAIEAFDDERVDRNYGDVSPESVIKVIESIPAVDAIPVEYLREKIKEHTDEEGWQDYLSNSFGLCIEEWQNEQEAR